MSTDLSFKCAVLRHACHAAIIRVADDKHYDDPLQETSKSPRFEIIP